MSPTTFAWLVLLFPLLGSIVIGCGYKAWPGRAAGLDRHRGDRALLRGLDRGAALAARPPRLGPPAHAPRSGTTRALAGLDIKLNVFVDPLSVFMILVVSGVSTLIHLYSVAYMESDRGYTRFFSLLNFFVFSMLLLVLAGNFVLLIVGWAFVGFASYALISFWYRRATATAAGMKAFVINVFGDVGLVFAAILIQRDVGGTRLRPGLRARRRRSSPPTSGRWSRSACCCSSAPSRSRRSCRSTPGFPTRWRARLRSRR